MITVIFYSSILLFSTLFVWLSERGRTRIDCWIFLCIAFLLVFIPSAIRYDIGTDYLNYLRILESGSYVEYRFKEPIFYFINLFIDSTGLGFQWLFFIFSFIFTFVAFKSYSRKNSWLLHFLFFSMLWFFSFNGIRQAIALSFCLLALFNYFERRYVWFFVLVVIASFFHQSALLVGLAGILAFIPLLFQFKAHIAPLVFIAILAVGFFSINIILFYMEQTLNLLGMTKYASYFHNSKHFIPRDFGTGLGVLAKVMFSIYVIFNTKSYLYHNKRYWLLIALIFAYSLGLVLANNIVIFGRMASTFAVAQVVGAYILWHLPRNTKINRLVVIGFSLFLILSFVKDGFGVPSTYGDPKRNPYQTIFNVET